MKTRKKDTAWQSIKILVYSFTIAFILKLYIFSPFIVEGASMQPTLHNHDYLFVNKASFHISSIERGEVVIIKKQDDPKYYVKRIIGRPNDKVSIMNGLLYVNGKSINENYLNGKLRNVYKEYLQFNKVKVPNHSYLVMGDNRLNSMDSRNGLGYIKQSEIVGKVEGVFYPFDRLRIIH
ncbi:MULTISPECIES: signal peptidase I [unclassified Bacillus (in: firmicutes)]|uniref:signal peptidase I n=1 Tax=unclassified Bacillus (in: firmicutes) TaxID=185979 RepID=UPI00211D5A5B|nr:MULTISPECIES: signal peptidase I [unclassified Bacillus (in: firmicutes)]